MARSAFGQSGIYNATPLVLTDGEGAGIGLDVSGNAKVSQATLLAGEDLTANRMLVEQRNTPNHITTATTTVVKAGAGFLHSIVVGETAAGAITVYDNTAGSGTVVAVLKASIAEGTYTFNCTMATGITVVTAAASKITVNYR